MSEEEKLASASGLISKVNRRKLDFWAQEHKLPISILVAIAIENELLREHPFDYDVSIPLDEYERGTYTDMGVKIFNWMVENGSGSLAYLCLAREDMGITTKEDFLLGFKDARDNKQIEAYKPVQPKYSSVKYDDDFKFYRIPMTHRRAVAKVNQAAKEYQTFIKLREKYKDK